MVGIAADWAARQVGPEGGGHRRGGSPATGRLLANELDDGGGLAGARRACGAEPRSGQQQAALGRCELRQAVVCRFCAEHLPAQRMCSHGSLAAPPPAGGLPCPAAGAPWMSATSWAASASVTARRWLSSRPPLSGCQAGAALSNRGGRRPNRTSTSGAARPRCPSLPRHYGRGRGRGGWPGRPAEAAVHGQAACTAQQHGRAGFAGFAPLPVPAAPAGCSPGRGWPPSP